MSTSQPSESAGPSPRRARGPVWAGALAVALVIGLAACGGGSGKPSVAASDTTTTTTAAERGRFAAAFTAFTSCMSQHGVKFQLPRRTGNGPRPTGQPGEGGFPGGGRGFGGGGFGGGFSGGFDTTPSSLPPGVTAAQYQSAVSACRSKLPTGRFGARGGAATAAYRSCMSDHGVKLPTFGGFGSSSTTASSAPPTTFNRNDPKFQAANKICAPLLPSRGATGTTTTTAG